MHKSLFYRQIIYSLLITFGMILVWILLNTLLSGNVWEGMVISNSALIVEYCEFNNVCELFHQKMNTYSNLAYFFFGVLIFQIGLNDFKNLQNINKNRLAQFPALSILMGICLIYLSFGSAFFHASLTYMGQRVDMNGTYSISIALLGIALYYVFAKIEFSDNVKKIWITFLILMIFAFIKIALLVSSSKLLPALILIQTLLVLVIYFQNRKEKSLLLAITSLILMVIAVKIRTLDVQKIGCDPYSIYQGHAVWHFLTALSSFCSYAFFRFSKKKL
jgi:hypothetical protein